MTTSDISQDNSAAPAPAPVPKRATLAFINTGAQITFMHEGHSICVPRTKTLLWEQVTEALRKGTATAESLAAMVRDADSILASALVNTPELKINADGDLTFNGHAVPNSLTVKLKACLEEGFGAEPFIKFLRNLVQNPRQEVMEHLYAFLEFGQMAIDDDGCFLAYKAVRPDYKDIHSATLDNSIGSTPSMPPWAVDPNRNRTCSRGLHVCSFRYLPHFSHANGHVMVCRVNPKDVVAIPADYNNTKMRVATYEVIDEYKGYYDEFPMDVLAQRAVIASNTSFEDAPFQLTVNFEDIDFVASFAENPSPESILEAIENFCHENFDAYAGPAIALWRKYVLVNNLTGSTLVSVTNSEFAGEDDQSGRTYFIIGHPDYEEFEATEAGTILLGTFRSRKRAIEALSAVASDESNPYGIDTVAVFSTEGDEPLDEAKRVMRIKPEQ